MSAKSAVEFANWLKKEHPALYRRAASAADSAASEKAAPLVGNSRAGLGETDSGWFSSFIGAAATLGGTYLNLKNQRDQLKINLQRAQVGQPPIDVAGTPILTTRVELPAGTVEKITQSAGMNINKILIFAALGIGAFFVLKRA